MGNFSNFIKGVVTGNISDRQIAINEKVNGLVIDTALVHDTGKWETGIEKKGNWIIVEIYENEEEAIKGHSEWVKKVKANKNLELKSARTAKEWFSG